jgi:hypothetical protein
MDKQTGRRQSDAGDGELAAQLEAELGFRLDTEGDVLDLEPHHGRATAPPVARTPRRPKEALRQSQQRPAADNAAQPGQSSTKAVVRPAEDPDPQEMLSLLEALGI